MLTLRKALIAYINNGIIARSNPFFDPVKNTTIKSIAYTPIYLIFFSVANKKRLSNAKKPNVQVIILGFIPDEIPNL